MKLIEKNIDTLIMKYPASWHTALQREGLVSGNGLIGANIYGGIKEETVIINHSMLWSGGTIQMLPNVSGSLYKAREAMDIGDFDTAHWALTDALKEHGYDNKRDYPLPLAELNITYTGLNGFSDYLRAVNMETGEVSSQFKENGAWVKKDLFVSRKDNAVILSIKAERNILNAEFSLDTVKSKNHSEHYRAARAKSHSAVMGNMLAYSSKNTDGLQYGAVAKIESADGDFRTSDRTVKVTNATEILIKIKVFVNSNQDIESIAGELKKDCKSYEYYLKRHIPLHKALYKSADFSLFSDDNHSNEELLLEAYSGKSPNELVEKLWRYGRYLFISGSCEEGLPFAMYGLWAYDYNHIWSHYMANENIQMIYWHTFTGNMCELNKPLFEYYNSRMDYFRENARNLYGCNGIFIPAGTTPNMPLPCQLVPVILNWTGAAGWLAQHYYRYYQYTRDKELLFSTILPFMKAAADFYEDFIVYDDEGNIKIYPSVSPENSPQNFIISGKENAAHPMTTTVNSTIDLAIIKEFFTNIISISAENDIYGDKISGWRKIADSIPDYKTNADGAVREWQDERFDDRYSHRHLSHIYPVFPGEEIKTENEYAKAFERAVDLREICSQTGWSLAHMASIYARFERGNDAMRCLNDLSRSCMQQNFFTLHNDWRRMGISLEMESDAPIQLDALMGYVNAVQEMILYSTEKLIKLLPSLPDNMKKGRITSWRFTGGTINMEWDVENGSFCAVLYPVKNMRVDIKLPKPFSKNITVNGSFTQKNHDTITASLIKNNKYEISAR